MLYQLILLLGLGSILPPPAAEDFKREDPDYARFLGRWTVTGMTREGQPVADRPKTIRFLDKLALPKDQGFLGYLGELQQTADHTVRWAYAVDSTGPRPRLYITHFEQKQNVLGPLIQVGVPSLLKGTYSIERDRLTLFLAEEGAELPRNLDPKGKGITVLELRRDRDNEAAAVPDVVVELVADGKQELLLTGRTTGVVQLWSLPQGKELAQWRGHDARIISVAMSRDGNLGLTADVRGHVCMWNLGQRQLVRKWHVPTEAHPPLATLSGDGQSIYIAQSDAVEELDAVQGVPRRRFALSKPPATSLAVAPDGAFLLLGDASGALRRYSLQGQGPPEGELLYSLPKGGILHRLRISSDGKEVCLTGLERVENELPLFAKMTFGVLTLGIVWPFFPHLLERGYTIPFAARLHLPSRRVQKALLPHDALSGEAIEGDSFDCLPEGPGLVLYGKRSLWLLREPFAEILNSRDDQEGGPRLKLLAQDAEALVRTWLVGDRVVAARRDGRLEWYDLKVPPRPRRAEVPKPLAIRGDSRIEDLAAASQGNLVLAAGLTRGAGLWDWTGRFWGLCQAESHRSPRRFRFSPEGSKLYGTYDQNDYDPKLRKRRQERGLLRWPVPRAPLAKPQSHLWQSPPLRDFHHSGVYAVLKDDRQAFGLASNPEGRQDGLALWDLKTGRILRRFGDANVQVGAVTVSPDETLGLAQEEGSAAIHVWDLAKGQRLHQLRPPEGHVSLAGMGWNSQGDLVTCTTYSLGASSTESGQIFVWDVKTGVVRARISAGYQQHFAVASRADLLLTSGSDGLRVWDLRLGKLKATLLEPQLRGPVAVDPDGKMAAVAFGRALWIVDLDKPLPPPRSFVLLPPGPGRP